MSRSTMAAIAVFIIVAIISTELIRRWDQDQIERHRASAASFAVDRAQALQVGIERAQSANFALAALIKVGNGKLPDFDAIAATMLPLYPGASELVLAPNGVIAAVYPPQGNEKAMGLNVLEFAAQRKEAEISRDSGVLTLSGPLDLVQGGRGLVGRLPVFLQNASGESTFWGFTEVVMSLPQALSPGQLQLLRDQGYQYVLWRIHPGDGQKQTIDASTTAPLSNPIHETLQLPNGIWTLSIAPVHGWRNPQHLLLLSFAATAFSLLLAYLTKLLLQLREHKRGLETKVAEQTTKIGESKTLQETTFNAIPDLIWLKDENGAYLNCNALFERFTGLSRADILGKTDYDLFDKKLADFFRDHDRKAMQAGRARTNEEWLTFVTDNYHGLFETVKTPIRDARGKLIGVLGIARDITEHRRREKALHDSETRLTVALESARIGIWEADLKNRLWYGSPTHLSLLGYEPIDTPLDLHEETQRVHPDDRQELGAALDATLRGENPTLQCEVRIQHADGSYHWVSVRGKIMESDAEGVPLRVLGVRIDINELKEAEERVHWLAHFDPLTSLPNRTLLQARIDQAIAEARQSQYSLALLFVDLDHFKNVNDTLGHSIGDKLLLAVSERMRGVVGTADTVSRQGGDEFVLVLPGADNEQATHIARKLLAVLAQRYHIEQYDLVVTPSIGISLYPRDGQDFEALFRCADIAMYSAKRSGRNTFKFFTEEMQERSARMLQLENALRHALANGEFSLHYQPQISLIDNRIVGVEALLRWQHPQLGMVSPAEFIPIAEDSGQILAIGEWVMRTAATQLKQWLDAGLPAMTVSVNLSAVQFQHAHLPALISEILDAAQLPPQYLELELTERVAMDNPLDAITTMNDLHARGVRLSIDDFGTGYSSLNYLKRFPVWKLKVDQSFVRNSTDDAQDRAIVSAIISLAANLGLRTVAEGVETAEQLDLLRMHGCDEVQGYYFSKPLPAPALEHFVRTRQATGADPGQQRDHHR